MWKWLDKKLAAILLKIADWAAEKVAENRVKDRRRYKETFTEQSKRQFRSNGVRLDGRPSISHLYKEIAVIANKHADDMGRAIKEVEILRMGLSENPDVMGTLERAHELFKIDLNKGANRIKGSLIVPIVECQKDSFDRFKKNEDFIIGVFDNMESAECAVNSFSTIALSKDSSNRFDTIVNIKYLQYDGDGLFALGDIKTKHGLGHIEINQSIDYLGSLSFDDDIPF
jgi:hypothetical protein